MIVSSLGEGGMADVYLAIDTILNREVAIKVLRGELSKDPVTLLRFQREANAVSKLRMKMISFIGISSRKTFWSRMMVQ